MQDGYAFFVRRALLALGVYTALSGLTYFLEGRLGHWFFNPAVNNLVIGSFVLFAFCLSARKNLEGLPVFREDRKWLALLLVLALLVLGVRVGFEEGLPRKALSALAGALIAAGFLGKELSARILQKQTKHLAASVLTFYVIDYVFDWGFLGLPVLSALVWALKALGVNAFLDATVIPPTINVFNVGVRAVEETSGVDALILYSIVFLGLYVGKRRGTPREFAERFLLGLLGAFALVFARLFLLVILFRALDMGTVNALALNPLNQLVFLAYPLLFWRKTRNWRRAVPLRRAGG